MENLTTEAFKTKVFDYTTSSEFKFVGTKPALIDFYADWCGPCKMVGPILEELSTEYPGVDFYKVDTEAEPELAAAFNIRGIPAILFIPLTGQPGMSMGAQPKEAFKKRIVDFLGQ